MSAVEPEPEATHGLQRETGTELGAEGYLHRNCLASYIHLHFGSCPELAEAFVNNCMRFK